MQTTSLRVIERSRNGGHLVFEFLKALQHVQSRNAIAVRHVTEKLPLLAKMMPSAQMHKRRRGVWPSSAS